MKTTSVILVSMGLLVSQLCIAQQTDEERAISEENKSILLEGGINVSLPVHIELYRTHRYAVGANLRVSKKISPKTELGIRTEYDYRFARPIPDMTGTIKGRALHSNFSLITLKPGIQFSIFNLKPALNTIGLRDLELCIGSFTEAPSNEIVSLSYATWQVIQQYWLDTLPSSNR